MNIFGSCLIIMKTLKDNTVSKSDFSFSSKSPLIYQIFFLKWDAYSDRIIYSLYKIHFIYMVSNCRTVLRVYRVTYSSLNNFKGCCLFREGVIIWQEKYFPLTIKVSREVTPATSPDTYAPGNFFFWNIACNISNESV